MSRKLATPCLAGLALLGLAGAGRAQSPSLQRVDSLLAAGVTAAARTELDRVWADASGERLDGERRAHALHLRAVLAADFDSAESDLLDVVLGYPTAAQAPDALLRLGQGLLATGQLTRATEYLQRLVRDYPASPVRPTAVVWLARARRRTAGDPAACETLREEASSAGADDDAGALLDRELATCAGPSVGAPSAARFAVQLGAFRDASNAAALERRARSAGVDPRLVTVGSGSLRCVRVGRFSTAADAENALRRLRAAGLRGVVVDDVRDERPIG